jgi:hypothetical protein
MDDRIELFAGVGTAHVGSSNLDLSAFYSPAWLFQIFR